MIAIPEILEVVKEHVDAEVTPRSMHLNAAWISASRNALGRTTYGSLPFRISPFWAVNLWN
jgi:hypothetical protein